MAIDGRGLLRYSDTFIEALDVPCADVAVDHQNSTAVKAVVLPADARDPVGRERAHASHWRARDDLQHNFHLIYIATDGLERHARGWSRIPDGYFRAAFIDLLRRNCR